MASLECMCCLQFWQYLNLHNHVSNPTFRTKKRKKISVVFDEGLQILVSSEKCIWNSLFKVSIRN